MEHKYVTPETAPKANVPIAKRYIAATGPGGPPKKHKPETAPKAKRSIAATEPEGPPKRKKLNNALPQLIKDSDLKDAGSNIHQLMMGESVTDWDDMDMDIRNIPFNILAQEDAVIDGGQNNTADRVNCYGGDEHDAERILSSFLRKVRLDAHITRQSKRALPQNATYAAYKRHRVEPEVE